MSKTLGNVIDPLDTIKEYGTDALRFTIALGTAGQVCFVVTYESILHLFKIVTFKNKLILLYLLTRNACMQSSAVAC